MIILREITSLYIHMIGILFSGDWRIKEIFKSIVNIGVGSLAIVTVSTVFAGLVVTKEVAWHMNEALNTVNLVPGFTGQFIIRELGIAVATFLVVSKVGASITAEVSTMKITEQIDALKLLRINPIAYLVFPRWIACIFSLVCLTLIANGVTLLFSMGMAVWSFGFNWQEYISILRQFVGPIDLVCASIKSMTYGAVIPIISCAYGFQCKGGAEGVGDATTNSVVTASMTVIVLDFILTYLFSFFL